MLKKKRNINFKVIISDEGLDKINKLDEIINEKTNNEKYEINNEYQTISYFIDCNKDNFFDLFKNIIYLIDETTYYQNQYLFKGYKYRNLILFDENHLENEELNTLLFNYE